MSSSSQSIKDDVVSAAENYWGAKCAYVAALAQYNSIMPDEGLMNTATLDLLDAELFLCDAVRALKQGEDGGLHWPKQITDGN